MLITANVLVYTRVIEQNIYNKDGDKFLYVEGIDTILSRNNRDCNRPYIKTDWLIHWLIDILSENKYESLRLWGLYLSVSSFKDNKEEMRMFLLQVAQ